MSETLKDVRALAERLLVLAEKATPGPRVVKDDDYYDGPLWYVQVGDDTDVAITVHVSSVSREKDQSDAEFVAAASPDAVTALARAYLAAERHLVKTNANMEAMERDLYLRLGEEERKCEAAENEAQEKWEAFYRRERDEAYASAAAAEARLEQAEAENDRMRDVTLPALRLSLETEILPGLKASAQVWETQRAERAVSWLIAALAAGQPEAATRSLSDIAHEHGIGQGDCGGPWGADPDGHSPKRPVPFEARLGLPESDLGRQLDGDELAARAREVPLIDQAWVTKVTQSDEPEVSVIGGDVPPMPGQGLEPFARDLAAKQTPLTEDVRTVLHENLWELYGNSEPQPTEAQPYLTITRTVSELAYNPAYGDERLCVCGHPYYRHFDAYENMRDVGCKYCDCETFVVPWRMHPGAPTTVYRCTKCGTLQERPTDRALWSTRMQDDRCWQGIVIGDDDSGCGGVLEPVPSDPDTRLPNHAPGCPRFRNPKAITRCTCGATARHFATPDPEAK